MNEKTLQNLYKKLKTFVKPFKNTIEIAEFKLNLDSAVSELVSKKGLAEVARLIKFLHVVVNRWGKFCPKAFIEAFRICASDKVTLDYKLLIGVYRLSGYQLEEVRLGFKYGLTREQVEFYAKPYFEALQMDEIRLGFERGLSFEQVSVYAKPEFGYNEMREIRLGFEHGLTQEQVEFYAKPEYPYWLMRIIRESFESKFTLSPEQKEFFINFSTNLDCKKDPRECIKIGEVFLGFVNGLSIDQIKIYARSEFDGFQMREIRLGLKDGLSLEQIRYYAKPYFDSTQMREIRLGFVKGLTQEQIDLYAKSEFTSHQMREIRLGFEEGLSMEQVMLYAKPELSFIEMKRIRKELVEQVKKRPRPERRKSGIDLSKA